jgi:elongation factor P--(R)-beta-lysine ligase
MWNVQSPNWQPQVTPEICKKRQDLMYRIRSFFLERGYLEVETPILSQRSGVDPSISVFTTHYGTNLVCEQGAMGYFITSPEFHMKRLLAAGYPKIFQLVRCLRNGESGAKHNPEFTMLEWYDPAGTLDSIEVETRALFTHLGFTVAKKQPYYELCERLTGLDFSYATLADFKFLAQQKGIPSLSDCDTQEWESYLFATLVEPNLGHTAVEFVCDYPVWQAALAKKKTDAQGRMIAQRFEAYYKGVELCNAYQELTDPAEQKLRFLADQTARARLGRQSLPYDERLIEALQAGLPECAGNALGVDRLLMLQLGLCNLNDVLTFPWDLA